MAKRRYKKKSSPKTALAAVLALVIAAVCVLFGIFNQKEAKTYEDLAVHYIDVGQGDAILIQAPTGENMLIDAGPGSSEEDLVKYLKDFRVESLDYFVLTHPDEDHIGGADRVFESCTVSTVIMPECERDTKAYRNLIDAIEAEEDCEELAPQAGDVYTFCEGAAITVLSPLAEKYDDVNDYSVVLRMDYYESSFLFTGDAGTEVEEQMLGYWEEEKLDCDVLKVGHHGSYTSSSQAFLEAVTPQYAVISCGKSNKYGHPHAEITSRLENEGTEIYRTDRLGSIVLTSDGDTVTVEENT